MGSLNATPGLRSWLLAALALAALAPPAVALPAIVVLAGLWLLTRPAPAQVAIVGVATAGALALLVTAWVAVPAGDPGNVRLLRGAARGYAATWAELDRRAGEAAVPLAAAASGELEQLEAFEILTRAAGGEVTLLLTDANGSAVAWAGPGLLHEPRQAELEGGERTFIAGFSAVTLLRVMPLGSEDRPWRLVAGRSLSSDRLFSGSGTSTRRELRWTLIDADQTPRPGLLRVTQPGAPTLVIESTGESGEPEVRAWDVRQRAAILILALAALLVAGWSAGAGGRPLARWLRPEVAAAVVAAGLGLGVTLPRVAGLVAALGWVGLSWRTRAAGESGGTGWRGVPWGLAAAAAALAAGLALQLARGPIDLGSALAAEPGALALRVTLAALVLGLILRAMPLRGVTAGAADGWAWLSITALLAGAAAHDLPVAAGALLLAGGGAAGYWAARSPGRPGTVLGVLAVCSALVAGGAWELAYRAGLRRHLEHEVLPRLALPTNAELAALSLEIRDYLAGADLETVALQDPEELDRQDLAYELWHHSPLATRGVLSALAVVPEEGPISTFEFGLPLTEAGRPDDSPLRRPEPALPVWDDTREAGSVELSRGGRRWGVVRYWLKPRPGFRLAALPSADLAARLLRDGPFLRPPAEEIAAPASFALFAADGAPVYSAWAEGPRLDAGLLAGGSGRLDTPAGPATVYAAAGPEGVRALLLPRLPPGRALERVGVQALSVLALFAVALALAGLLGGGARLEGVLRRSLRSYSRRMLAVYGLLLLLPVLLLSALFVRFTSERLERDQRASGEAALESAQRVLGEYVLSLETGFVIDTQLDNELLVWLAGVIRHDVNLYWGSTFYVSSKPELFTAGFLPKRIPGEIYARLLLRSRERASRVNRVGGADYLELYAPLDVPGVALDRARLFVSVPLLAQQEEVASEIAALRRRAALVTSALILLMAAVGARLARAFSQPLMEIVEGTQRIAEGAESLALEPADEELATLARAIDRMAARIAEGRRQLTREKKLVELTVENINAGVMSLDAERRVVLHNRVARQLLGVRLGEPIDAALAARPELAELAGFVAAAGGRPRQRTIRLGEEDDEPKEWSLVWAPLPGHGESAALLVVEDVTEVLRVERLEAWAEMARIIAHEIKNPLTPIRLSADHMRQVWRENPEEFEEVFERCTANILHQVDELRAIAMEFSTYSRIPRIERRPGDLTAAVAEVAEAYGASRSDAARVRWHGPDGPLPLELDARLIGRAVRNLIENALRASPEGSPIDVRLEVADGAAVVRVADQGPGVPAELLGKIFDPYFSTHDSGTGLGLPIARRIAEAHGGSMRAHNRHGGGLEVEIRLPLGDGPGMAAPAAETAGEPA